VEKELFSITDLVASSEHLVLQRIMFPLSDPSSLISSPTSFGIPSETLAGGSGSAVAGVVISDESIVAEAAGLFSLVVRLAIANMIFNLLRPDSQVSWSLRLPRMLWELSLAVVARGTTEESGGRRRKSKKSKNVEDRCHGGAATPGAVVSTVPPVSLGSKTLLSASPSRYLLLAIMLIATALTDIFVWAPVFAAAISFHSCTGGWLTGEPRRCQVDLAKGYGRAIVVAQCVIGGTLYLLSGISAWNVYSIQQQRRVASRHAELRQQHWIQQQAEWDRRRWLLEEEERRSREAAKKEPDGSSFWSTPNFWPTL
jgi:hypothetical protein